MFISLICNVVVCVMLDVTLQPLAPRGQTFCALLHCVAISFSVTFSMNHLFAYNSRSVFNFFLPCLLTLVPVCRPMSLEMTTMKMKAVGILSVTLQSNHSLCETLHLERGRGRKGEGWKGASPPRGKGEVVQFPRITHFHH